MESRRARPAGFSFRRGASGPGTAPVTAAAVKKQRRRDGTPRRAGGRPSPLTDADARSAQARRRARTPRARPVPSQPVATASTETRGQPGLQAPLGPPIRGTGQTRKGEGSRFTSPTPSKGCFARPGSRITPRVPPQPAPSGATPIINTVNNKTEAQNTARKPPPGPASPTRNRPPVAPGRPSGPARQ
jgi:hypothetical protein